MFREGVDKPTRVHTHAVVIRNAGRKPAKNVRLGHRVLENFEVSPSTDYTVTELDDGSKELLFPTLIPKQEVTVSYLYFPPVLYTDINTYAKSDEGFATFVNALPTPQPSRSTIVLAAILMAVGFVAILYVLAQGIILARF